MKKNHIYILFSVAMLNLLSCTESFLEVKPTSALMESNYYDSPERIETGLVAAYQPLLWNDYAFGGWAPLLFISDIMSDDVRVGGGGVDDQPSLHLMRNFSVTPEINFGALWVTLYSGVNRANIILEKLPSIQGLSASRKSQIEAESRFLRAYYYSWLWKLWGNIPYYNTNPTVTPYLVAQVTPDVVYAKMIEDLNFVIASQLADKTVLTAESGRATKDAARMLKAQIVMYQNDASKYPEVLNDMKSMIESTRYTLMSNFLGVFDDAGEWCTESIWEINYTDKNATRDWGNALAAGGTVYPKLIGINGGDMPVYEGGWGFEPVEKSLYDIYDDADRRKDAGILNFAKYKIANPTATYSPRYDDTGYFNRKYIARKGGNSNCTSGSLDMNFRNNLRIFRFSETLLNAAELLIRTNGDLVSAKSYMDRVRARAYAGPNGIAATLDNILIERRKEFALEGHRFWDLVRFGKAVEVLGARGYTENKKYLPIPASEIDKAYGTLTQNPY